VPERGSSRTTGHLQVKGARGQRAWYALWRDATGRHQRRLGPAWVKDSGRRTARGAIVWRAADGPKPDASYLTPADAEVRLRDLLAGAPRKPPGRGAPAARVTFSEACEEWLRYVTVERRRAPSTLRDYRRVLDGVLVPEFGAATPLDRITSERIDAYRERLLTEDRLSRRTIQKTLVILHGVLRRAKRRGWIAYNPAADTERVTVSRTGEFSVLTPAEVHAVARAAGSEWETAMYIVAAFTGLRQGELRALRWTDVDFAKHLVHVRRAYAAGVVGPPKSRKVRSVPMSDQVARTLDGFSRRAMFTAPEDLVFAGPDGGPFHADTVRKAFYRALDRAGLGHMRAKAEPITFHDLRHTFGTLAVQAFPLTDVKAMMGHADISTTMIYVHHVPQIDAAARLTGVFGAATGIEDTLEDEGVASGEGVPR
jgi:integrase